MIAAEARTPLRQSLLLLVAIAGVVLMEHLLLGNSYGFHQDELQFLDDARHLHWGFAAYPPLTSFLGRIAINLFGICPSALRLPVMLVNAFSLVLAGLLTRELGGGLGAQALAAVAVLPVALIFSSVLQYNSFDYAAWTVLAFSIARILHTGDGRWWLAAGIGMGLGVLSKYTIALPVISLGAALCLLPSQRHHLRSAWLWLGVLAAAIIASPNLYWLATHHFLTLQMEHYIHLRDVRMGRAATYYSDQLRYTLFALPLALAGLVWLVRSPRFRILGVLYMGPFLLLAVAKGRGYYLLPAYVVLYAAGSVWLERVLARRSPALRRVAWSASVALLLASSVVLAFYYLPVFTQGSRLWLWQMRANPDMDRELGWPQLAAQVASIRDGLSPARRRGLAVLAEDYSSAGALALYGPAYGLPAPISTANSFYDRGWGPYPPRTVIVVGGHSDDLARFFSACRVQGSVKLPFGAQNDLTCYDPEIFVCSGERMPWAQIWAHGRQFQ